ncbi:MAG: DDE-type integrase/transposase/recombinase [Acetobacteraceae bacterium]|nr:DDE-type integrase/transposase/recombinase [Acetobacteraceae bacterium]
MLDRPSRPRRSPGKLSEPAEAEVVALRHQRRTAPAMARRLGRPLSTVGVVLRRHGLGRLRALDPRPPVVRYERERPGELIHVDIKKLGRIDGVGHRISGDRTGQSNKRGTGWEFLHVAIDDASRLAYTEVLGNESKESAVAFTRRALAWFARHGVKVERLMSDNGSAYRSFAVRDLLAARGITHKRTRPYTPRTNVPEVSMMLMTPKLRVIHVTTHIGLIDAIERIDPPLVQRTIERAYGHGAGRGARPTDCGLRHQSPCGRGRAVWPGR